MRSLSKLLHKSVFIALTEVAVLLIYHANVNVYQQLPEKQTSVSLQIPTQIKTEIGTANLQLFKTHATSSAVQLLQNKSKSSFINILEHYF